MSTNNYAYGNAVFKNLPAVNAGAGTSFPFGQQLPPGGRVLYVRSTGPQDGDDPTLVKRINLTLAAALLQCRAGMGDTVIVLPGHSESVTDATMLTNLVAGTRVIGVGDVMQDDAPTFRWTATASQWAVTAKNCTFANLKLRLEGASGVVKAIVTTAAATKFIGNYIETASGASNKATIALEVGSGATDCVISNNYFTGTETHNSTDVIKLVGATVPSRTAIVDNVMICSATAANGLIHVTVAAKRLWIYNNTLYNTHTSSSASLVFDAVACDGIARNNFFGVMNDGTAASQGVTFGAGSLVKCFNNQCCDEPQKSGVLAPAAAT